MSQLLTPQEVADILKVKKNTVYEMVKRRILLSISSSVNSSSIMGRVTRNVVPSLIWLSTSILPCYGKNYGTKTVSRITAKRCKPFWKRCRNK